MSKNEFPPNEQTFIDWLATPESERRIKTQEQLADVLGLHRMTLSRWKQRKDISRAVTMRKRQLAGVGETDLGHSRTHKKRAKNDAHNDILRGVYFAIGVYRSYMF